MKLDELAKKIGKAVEDSKPYWEARRVARQVRRPEGVCSTHIFHGRLEAPAPREKVMTLNKDGCLR